MPFSMRCAAARSISRRTRALWLSLALLPAALAPVHADPANAPANDAMARPVVVTGTRDERSPFDLPASITVIDRDRVVAGTAGVNASEALSSVPGLVALNRQNFAQDLQISSRGFGARSAFGVRGIRLVADGIPASMPDGQGQVATFDLDQLDRIEILRGPFSAIHGNHAGGVIHLVTREGEGPPVLESGLAGGSDGLFKTGTSLRGSTGPFHYLVDGSHFETDGFRAHSAASREQGLVRLGVDLDDDTRLRFTGNLLRQHDTEDPLGLDWHTARSNPREAVSAASLYDTRKSIDHLQGGLAFERRFGAHRLHVDAYGGNRRVIQFQSIPKAVQLASARHSGGVIEFDRDFFGLGLRVNGVRDAFAGRLNWSAGIETEASLDRRRGFENFRGDRLGVKGTLRRRERDDVRSIAPHLQASWDRGAFGLTAGARYSHLRFEVDDRYRSNGDDSGHVSFGALTPVFGVLYRLSPALHLYASVARGFEAPTLNELFYSGSGGGFAFDLEPARSLHVEAGAKLETARDTRVGLALFQVRTRDELVVDSATGGRTRYRNAGRTRRSGVELEAETTWTPGLSSHLAFTHLAATYTADVSGGSARIAAGNRLPGVPATSAYVDLVWRHAPSGLEAAIEGVYRSRIFVEDTNQQPPAPGALLAHLRLGLSQSRGGWSLSEFVRVDDVFDRRFIGSVIVGDTNQRYYEPAPGRSWLAGIRAAYAF